MKWEEKSRQIPCHPVDARHHRLVERRSCSLMSPAVLFSFALFVIKKSVFELENLDVVYLELINAADVQNV